MEKYKTSIWVENQNILDVLESHESLYVKQDKDGGDQYFLSLKDISADGCGYLFSFNQDTGEFFRNRQESDDEARVDIISDEQAILYTESNFPVDVIKKLSEEYEDSAFFVSMSGDYYFTTLPVDMKIKDGKVVSETIDVNWPGLKRLNDTDLALDGVKDNSYLQDEYELEDDWSSGFLEDDEDDDLC